MYPFYYRWHFSFLRCIFNEQCCYECSSACLLVLIGKVSQRCIARSKIFKYYQTVVQRSWLIQTPSNSRRIAVALCHHQYLVLAVTLIGRIYNGSHWSLNFSFYEDYHWGWGLQTSNSLLLARRSLTDNIVDNTYFICSMSYRPY